MPAMQSATGMPKAASPRAANRFEALDGWRGVCACFVVLFHFHGYSPIYTSPLVRHSWLFVDFFFVLSGFVIAWNYADRLSTGPEVRRFMVLRLGRVYPLHLFMLACFVAYEGARWASGTANGAAPFTGEMRPWAAVSNLFLLQGLHVHDSLTWNGPAWSISTEAWTYAIFALVCAAAGLRGWMLAAAAIVPPAVLYGVSTTGMDVTYDWGLVRCVFGFALGVACCQFVRHRPPLLRGSGTAGATAIELVVVAAVVLFVSATGHAATSILAPFVFAVAVLVFASEQGWVSRLFRTRLFNWLGQLSYSIYLTHFLFVLVLPVVLKRVLHQDLWSWMPVAGGDPVWVYGRNAVEGTLFYGVVVALTLGFSALTYRWVETPGREWSRRWAKRVGGEPIRATTHGLNGPSIAAPARDIADAKSFSTPTIRRA